MRMVLGMTPALRSGECGSMPSIPRTFRIVPTAISFPQCPDNVPPMASWYIDGLNAHIVLHRFDLIDDFSRRAGG